MDKGIKRAHTELEVVRFIKQQKTMRIVLRTLFTDLERFLIRNQQSTVLGSTTEGEHVSSSGSEVSGGKFANFLYAEGSIFGSQLLKGAVKSNQKRQPQEQSSPMQS